MWNQWSRPSAPCWPLERLQLQHRLLFSSGTNVCLCDLETGPVSTSCCGAARRSNTSPRRELSHAVRQHTHTNTHTENQTVSEVFRQSTYFLSSLSQNSLFCFINLFTEMIKSASSLRHPSPSVSLWVFL